MQTQYYVSCCPYRAIDGEYCKNATEQSYNHVSQKYYMDRLPQRGWAIRSDSAVFCKNLSTSLSPPVSGWEYWSSKLARYVPIKNMEVNPIQRMSTGTGQAREAVADAFHQTDKLPLTTAVNEATTNLPSLPPVVASRAGSRDHPLQEKTLRLNEIDPYGDWEMRTTPGYLSSSTVYSNKKTGKQQTAFPEEFARAQTGDGHVVSYFLPSVGAEGQIEVFAPANYARATKRDIVQRGYYSDLNECLPFWAHTVGALEKEIADLNDMIGQLRAKENALPKSHQGDKTERATAEDAAPGANQDSQQDTSSPPLPPTSTLPNQPTNEAVDIAAACDALIAQFEQAKERQTCEEERARLRSELDAARKSQSDNRYTLIVKLGRELMAAEAQLEQLTLSLSEEDYQSLPERHAALLQKVDARCAEIAQTDDYDALEQLAGKLAALRALDLSEFHHSGANDPVYVEPDLL